MDIRQFIKDNNLSYLLINSTNEFLVEYNALGENSRYKLTNFSGSTGEALITPETIFLFVDGRYHIQADQEVDHSKITVVKLQTGQKYLDELISRVPENEILGVFAKKNSQAKIEKLQLKRKILLLDNDPYDNTTPNIKNENISLDIKYTGLSCEEKLKQITNFLEEDEFIYLTDLDEVSYVFNMRNYSQNFSAKIKAKALISKDNALLFTQDKLGELEKFLSNINSPVYVDKATINAFDYRLLGTNAKDMDTNPVQLMKAQKNERELQHLKDAFKRSDDALSAVRDYIENNDKLSEYEISTKLEQEFKKQGALGLSFNSIVAKDKNSALAHYSKSSKDEYVEDGNLVLIDCGAYFEGGLATDMTRVFVKGEPSQLHKKIYTYVLKAFLQAYNYSNTHEKRPITGYEIDNFVREFFDKQNLDGFVFNHGLGHGIGINVHEYPPNLSLADFAKVPLLEGECFSIEPGLYKEGFFGVRLENSCYFKDNKIHSFSNMCYEKKLIDFTLLTTQETEWLREFEVR